MSRRRWAVGFFGVAVGVAGVLLAPSAALAKRGMIVTQYGPYEGDVEKSGDKWVVTAKDGRKTSIPASVVQKTLYFDTNRQEFDAKMGLLAKNDVAGRLKLAQWAIEQKEYDMAKEALDSAAKIDATNAQIKTLQDTVNKQLAAANPPASQPAKSATQAAEAGAAGHREPVMAKREVTPAEINHIRQMEWREGDRTVQAKLTPEVRSKFIAAGIIPAQQASRMPANDLAYVIVTQGPPGLREQVQILKDPAPMLQFRRGVEKTLQAHCIQCHTVGKVQGNNHFALFAGDNDQAAYSNFIILQQFERKQDGVVRQMIDRNRPEDSLLLQYMLPPASAQIPHPPAQNYAGVVKTKSDPKYTQALTWLRGLAALAPDYGVDLSAEPGAPGGGAGNVGNAGGAAGPAGGGGAPAGAGR